MMCLDAKMTQPIEDRVLCMWYVLANTPASTTFEHVRALPIEDQMLHPLYECTVCKGYNPICLAEGKYRESKRYRREDGKREY